jgi:uncharacterized protein (DUF2235 family)
MMKKRLIICCDGTWNWPDQKGSPTNVVKMVRAIRPADDLGVPQIVFYDTGVGTGNWLDRIAGGMFGVGLAENVKQAYGFVVDNYQPDDELFFFGFSRGAYTVRSLSGLIGLIGLLPKQHMDHFRQGWAYYRTPPPQRTETQRRAFLARFPAEELPTKTRIDFIGVWDTVGTMGIPVGPLRMIGQQKYRFHNTNLGDNVARAFQALAIDERRRFFAPAIWRREGGLEERLRGYGIAHQVLEQTWFVGAHSNVGGGYLDTGLSDQAFGWMARRAMHHGLALDTQYVAHTQERSRYLLVNSRTAKWRLIPAKLRPLCQTDPSERIHYTAVQRFTATEAHTDFVPHPYDCPNLQELVQAKGQAFEELIDYDGEAGARPRLSGTASRRACAM